jgi:hypothetical protein
MKRKVSEDSHLQTCAAVAIAGTIMYFATPVLIAIKNRIKRKLTKQDIDRLSRRLAWAVETATDPWYVVSLRNRINELKRELR